MLGTDLKRIFKERKESAPAKSILANIRDKDYVGVMRALAEGTSANIDYYGVVPLMVAVTNGACRASPHGWPAPTSIPKATTSHTTAPSLQAILTLSRYYCSGVLTRTAC